MDNTVSLDTGPGAIIKKYAESDAKLYMPMDEAIALSHEITRRVTEKGVVPDEVVGIANGALLVTQVVAADLGLPFEMITIRRKGSAVKAKLSRYTVLVRLVSSWYKIPVINRPLVWAMKMMNGFKNDSNSIDASKYQGQHILLIDDATDSGGSLRRAEKLLTDHGCSQVTTAVISISKYAYTRKGVDPYVPDVYISQRMHHFPWSVNNSDYPLYNEWLKQNDLETCK